MFSRAAEEEGPSGFGFELTFRLKRAPDDRRPPTWPAELMQSLAKYVFNSGKLVSKSFIIVPLTENLFVIGFLTKCNLYVSKTRNLVDHVLLGNLFFMVQNM